MDSELFEHIHEEERSMQMIYAHRGASGYAPENTLRAFQKAAELRAHGVELDVQLTKDGQVVVIHDETIDRVTGCHGYVADFTYEELKQFPITNAVNADGTDRIPLLSDVLKLLKKNGLKLIFAKIDEGTDGRKLGDLIRDKDAGFVPIGVRFMADVGKHLMSMIDANRPK